MVTRAVERPFGVSTVRIFMTIVIISRAFLDILKVRKDSSGNNFSSY